MAPIYLGVFGIQLQKWPPKMKSECKAQYFSPLRLDKQPTCLGLKFFEFFEKAVKKLLLLFNQLCNFAVLIDFESLKPQRLILFHEQIQKLLLFGHN